MKTLKTVNRKHSSNISIFFHFLFQSLIDVYEKKDEMNFHLFNRSGFFLDMVPVGGEHISYDYIPNGWHYRNIEEIGL